jgi:hypothetical protein
VCRWKPKGAFAPRLDGDVSPGLTPRGISLHFNRTVELPLKAIARGYQWTVVGTQALVVADWLLPA